ncbi:MAG: hypothetical protein ACYDEN_00605 [Acidimicrobiales bacterium]
MPTVGVSAGSAVFQKLVGENGSGKLASEAATAPTGPPDPALVGATVVVVAGGAVVVVVGGSVAVVVVGTTVVVVVGGAVVVPVGTVVVVGTTVVAVVGGNDAADVGTVVVDSGTVGCVRFPPEPSGRRSGPDTTPPERVRRPKPRTSVESDTADAANRASTVPSA